jgi:hypothetical protein
MQIEVFNGQTVIGQMEVDDPSRSYLLLYRIPLNDQREKSFDHASAQFETLTLPIDWVSIQGERRRCLLAAGTDMTGIINFHPMSRN